MKSLNTRFSIICLTAWCTITTTTTTCFADLFNPKHFLEPTAATVFGLNNFVPTFGNGPGSIYGIESMGTREAIATYNLWAVGDVGTTKQEWTDLYNNRVIPSSGPPRTANVDPVTGFIHDGSASLNPPLLTAKAPGYITGTGNLYSYLGDYGAFLDVSNYGHGGLPLGGGTLVILQTSAGINPDVRPLYNVGAPTDTYYTGYYPLDIVFTKSDGSPLPHPRQILSFGINSATLAVDSTYGQVPWQELYWAVWLPEWDEDFLIDFGIPVHSAFSSVRVDTAIGTMSGVPGLDHFAVGFPTEQPSVVAAHFYHGGWSGSESPLWNALDTNKTVASPGEATRTLGFENLINSSQGVNGVALDIRGLSDLDDAQWEFTVSPQGAFNEDDEPISKWQAAPTPRSISVFSGVGQDSSDRVLIEWNDNAIANRWLRIKLTVGGFSQEFYLGHLLGETTGPIDNIYAVSFADIAPIRNAVGSAIDAGSTADIDKNGSVSFSDISAMRSNIGTQLTNITIP